MHYYRAFGLNIASEIKLPQLCDIPDFDAALQAVDVRVGIKDLSDISDADAKVGENGRVLRNSCESICYEIDGVGRFEIARGEEISLQPFEGVPLTMVSLYIMGHCFGCLLAQRKLFTLHGSCVCRGNNAIIISGYSGAGKSTLAAEFVSRGWKIMSDDITVIKKVDGVFCAVSSFPSQKLWQDSVDYYEYDSQQITSMKQEEQREKFHVDISDDYYEGIVPLTYIIKLTHKDETCSVTEYFGMKKVDKIIKNIYLRRSLNDDDANINAINTAVQLSGDVRLFYVKRNSNRDSSRIIYDTINKMLEEDKK